MVRDTAILSDLTVSFASILGQTASMAAKAGAAYENIVPSENSLRKFEVAALAARRAYAEHDLKCLNDAYAVVVPLGKREDS